MQVFIFLIAILIQFILSLRGKYSILWKRPKWQVFHFMKEDHFSLAHLGLFHEKLFGPRILKNYLGLIYKKNYLGLHTSLLHKMDIFLLFLIY